MENRVRIYRRDGAWVVDTGGRHVPNCAALTSYLPQTMRSSCSYLEVSTALERGHSPQSLSSALSAYYTEHPNIGEVRVLEGECTIPDNTAYMALGDNIYKMVPVRQASGARAFRLMRERIRVEGERLMTGLRAQAQQEAQGILTRAQEQAHLLRVKLDREANESTRVPNWLRGLAVTFDDYGVKVQWSISINITKLTYGPLSWDAIVTALPFGAAVWLPLSANSEHLSMVERSGPYLPHVKLSSCITLGERWGPIENRGQLERFANSISRALQVINLASLLEPKMSRWDARILPFLPPVIKAWLEVNQDNGSQAHNPRPENPTATTEGADSWNNL